MKCPVVIVGGGLAGLTAARNRLGYGFYRLTRRASYRMTASALDLQGSGGLASVPGKWQNRILLAGSEAGRRDAGYLAGAIEAAEYAAMEIMNKLETAE